MKASFSAQPKSYVLDYIYGPSKEQKFSVPEAIRHGLLDVTRGVYHLDGRHEIAIDQAIRLGYIMTKILDEAKAPEPARSLERRNRPRKSFESSTLAIESVVDAKTGQVFSIGQAIAAKLLDKHSLNYVNTVTGEVMSLDEAFKSGLAMGKFYGQGQVPRELAEIKTRAVFTRREERSFEIEGVLDPRTGATLSLEAAVGQGLFLRGNGMYVNPESGQSVNLNDAVRKGFVTGRFIDSQENPVAVDGSSAG